MGGDVVIENRTGAGGMIGSEVAAKAHLTVTRWCLAGSTDHDQPADLPQAALRRSDFAPASMLSLTAMVIVVHLSVPAKNVKELVALAKRAPASCCALAAPARRTTSPANRSKTRRASRCPMCPIKARRSRWSI